MNEYIRYFSPLNIIPINIFNIIYSSHYTPILVLISFILYSLNARHNIFDLIYYIEVLIP